ncbi:imelysin family protein [Rubrivirga sp. IMCC45206]|uniref:imelysin family protein n=1 Tax=Rubrivirga sp. IMCC45206 TaxID=3391614 RepID=UPI00398FE182
MRPFARPALLVAGLVVVLAACDSGGPGDPPPTPGTEFERSAMLTQWADAAIVPAYDALLAASLALQAEADAFAAAPTEASLVEVRAALRAARLAWQDASLFGFGPAEDVALRAALNTYPTDTGKVEANVASGGYTLGTLGNQAAAGFPAMAYLLYDGTEAEVVAAFADANRGAYLRDNAAFVADAVGTVAHGWDGYRGTFLGPANAGTDVGSALGMVVNGMVLHYERFLRDGSIGIPAGVRSAGVPRPTSVEAVHGGYSAELAVANLRALKRLFLGDALSGAAGTGLDDNLRAVDAGGLADEIVAEFDQAIAALEALRDPLDDQIRTDNAPVLAAFQEMQDVVVLLKADMASVLGVSITFQDNDGD